MPQVSLLLGICLATFAAMPLTAAPAGSSLNVYRWKSRVLVVVAPNPSDPRFIEQRRFYRSMGREARERDLVMVDGARRSGDTELLRRSFAIQPGEFRALLIGKDGGVKLSSATPLDASDLFPLIDAMPMRQEEMRRSTR